MFRLQTTKTSSLPAVKLAIITGTLLLTKLVCPAANPQAWVELRSPNFIVVTNSNEKQACLVAYQFETIRAVFRQYFQQSKASTDPSITIIAAKDEATFRDLLPEFWAKKGQVYPAALYRRGTNTNYVALRLDVLRPEVSLNAFASDAYRPIYEEYYAATMGQRNGQLPLWVAIGLTEVFGNTRVESKDVFVGMPSRSNLMVLQGAQLLPVTTLLEVNPASPYYREERKASIFYAESWALMHYLMTRDWRENTNRVSDFITLLHKGTPQREAASRTIGDPDTLQHALSKHIEAREFTAVQVSTPQIDEGTFRSRLLADAESVAVRTDFKAHDGHSPPP